MSALASNGQIVHALRVTIEHLEADPDVRPDDLALTTLKRLLLRRLAEKSDREDAQNASPAQDARRVA